MRSASVALVVFGAAAGPACGGGGADSGTPDVDRIAPTVAADPPGGIYGSEVAVLLTASEPAVIYYTLDGSAPRPDEAGTLEGVAPVGPLDMPEAETTLRFLAIDEADNRGEATTETYLVDLTPPAASVEPGSPSPIGLLGTTEISFTVDEAVQYTARLGSRVVASGDAVTGEPVLVEVPGYQLSYTTPARLTFLATDVAGHEGSASVEIGLKPLIDIEAGSYGEIVVSRDGTRAFVTDHQDDAIDVIDLDRGSPTFHSVIGTHSFGGEPRDLALTPADDRLYVLFQEDSLIAVIDTASLTVIDVFQAGLAPNGIAISPAGQRAYYASFDETIRVLDVDPASPTYNQELARFAPEPLLLSARSAVSADGRRLILAWSGMIAMGTTIIDIDPSSPSYLHVVARPLPLVSGGPHGVALSADGAHAFARVSRYVEEFGLALGDIDLETGAVAARTYSGPLGQLGLVATPDGRFLVSCSGNDPQLHLIDVAKMKAIESVSLGVAASMSCAITPDGSELYIPGEHRTWALPLF